MSKLLVRGAGTLAALRKRTVRLVVAGLLLLFSAAWAGPASGGGQAGAGAAWHKLQVQDRSLGPQLLAEGARLIADYGSYQLYDVPSGSPALAARPHTQLRDGYNFIFLHAARLDTSTPGAQAQRQAPGQFAGKRMRLVQFAGPIEPGWREELVGAGVQIIAYIPENTYLVYGDARSLGQVHALAATAPHVQWEGAYPGQFKVHPNARPVDAQGRRRAIGTEEFAVQLVADAEANPATLQLLEQLQLQAIKRKQLAGKFLDIVVALPPDALDTVAARPDVISIQPYFPRHKFGERQDQIVAGNLVGTVPAGPGYLAWLASKGFTQAQFANSGFVVDVSDSGIDNGTTTPNHPGLYTQGATASSSRVIYNRLEGTPSPGSSLKGCDGHGTLNSHIIGGYDNLSAFPYTDPAGYHYGLGVCPFVKLGSSVIFDPDRFTSPDYTALQDRAYNNGARISNNSWGGSTFGNYDIDAQEYDRLVRDAQPESSPLPTAGNQEMVIVFAAGNDGYLGFQTVGSPGTAKNIISVGAAENVQPFGGPDSSDVDDLGADSANDVIDFSSRGPCSDGRHKPDIMAPGTHVSGGVPQADNPASTGTADPCFDGSGVAGGPNGSLFWPDGQQLFTASSGTSHSAPCVAGACALVRQYFINNFNSAPSPAMTKAFLMNSTRYMTGMGANDTLWSDSQGMGELNLGMAFDGVSRVLRDQMPSDLFTASGQTRSFTGVIPSSSKPFRVTLAWTDAPGNTAGAAYNNDLDLTVTIGGITYKGNVFNGAVSWSGGTADSRNNVESVFLPVGVSGLFTVTVTAVNINSDGVPNNDSPLDQDFALVIYNGTMAIAPTINELQPTNLTVLVSQPAAFSVTASGSQPLHYQWYKNGRSLSGGTSNVFALASAQLTNAGAYSVVVANSYGAVTSAVASLSVIPTVPLTFALNNSNIAWVSTTTNYPWYGQTNLAHDATASGRSYFVGDGQQSTLSATVEGPGLLSFWWKVSSQTNADFLTFTAFGNSLTNTAQISGEADWTQMNFYVPSGTQTFLWTYSKDASLSVSNDAAYVDQVTYTPGPSKPFIFIQPAGTNIFASTPVTLSVTAVGTPMLAYQWRLNGADIPGATTASLLFTNPGAVDAGIYSVFVTNDYGSVLSADAYLGVVPLIANGDNSLGQLNLGLSFTNVVAIAAGAWHNLSLRADGTIAGWGEDYNGQCDVPAAATDAIAVAAGGYHSLALRLDQTVVGWGDDSYGQADVPPGLSNVIAIAAGTWHSLALRADGSVVAWGDDSYGQTNVPPGLSNVIAIAAGGNHSLALRADHTVVAWGENTDANGNFVGQSSVPWTLSDVVAIGAGEYHSLAAKADGSLVAWGDDSQGQCDPPMGLSNIVAVAGGGGHTVALKADGTVTAWGNDWDGQCAFPLGLTNVIAVAAGNSHSLVLLGRGPAAPRLLCPVRTAGRFQILIQTIAGKDYTLEYTTSLSAGNWQTNATVHGDGAFQFLTDTTATSPQRFYRVRQW